MSDERQRRGIERSAETEWTERFAGLSDESKMMIVQMGIECMLRAYSFHICGWTTLAGAMYYVKPDAPSVVDTMLNWLNGNREASERFQRFLNGDDQCKEIVHAFHIESYLFSENNEKANDDQSSCPTVK